MSVGLILTRLRYKVEIQAFYSNLILRKLRFDYPIGMVNVLFIHGEHSQASFL